MFKFLQELQNAHQIITRTATSDGSIAGLNDVATKAGTDVSFKNNQIDVNSQTGVDAAEVQDYLEKAKDINDEVDCVGFAVELDDSRLVKLYVNEKDAPAFEEELSTNLGIDKEFDELLVDLSKKYDVVDVIWPDQQDGATQQPAVPDTTTQDNTPSSDFSDQLPAVAGVAPAEQTAQPPSVIGQEQTATPVEQEKPQHQKDMDEFDELFGTSDPAEGEELPAEAETAPEGDSAIDGEEPKRSHHKKPEGESEETAVAPTEGETDTPPVEDEPKRSHHKKPVDATGEEAAPSEAETDDSAPTETVEKVDDDISVTIKHPKKKKKQVQESVSSEGGKKKNSSIFTSLGLDNNYQLVGATLPHPVQDKILALLGILKVPGSSLTKYPTLADEIIESSKLVISNGNLLNDFNKFFDAIKKKASDDEVSGYDTEYRTKLKNVLGKLGIQIDELGITVSTNALVLGATIISNNTDVKLLFNQIEPILMQEPPATDTISTINESIGILKRHKMIHHDNDDEGMTFGSFINGDEDEDEDEDSAEEFSDYTPRDHDGFEQCMKDQDSSYREWLPREDQVDLLNHYLSGVDIHCSTWKPHDGQSLEDHLDYIKKEHIPKSHQEFGYGEFDDGSYEIIFIQPHAINLGK